MSPPKAEKLAKARDDDDDDNVGSDLAPGKDSTTTSFQQTRSFLVFMQIHFWLLFGSFAVACLVSDFFKRRTQFGLV